MTDRELLRRYVEGGDPGAFGELVGRHVDLVHGVARREVGEAEAGDVVQAVFLLLSQRAAGLRGEVSVSGWLFRTARFCCANARKLARRRAHYERVAAMAGGGEEEVSGERFAREAEGVLDEALGSVPADYREAVLMRYLEGRSVEETAAELGVSAAAAGKRATRGLEMLRGYFAMAGYRVGMQSVTGALAMEAAKRAPGDLGAGVAGAVGSGAVTGHAAMLATMTGKMLGGVKALAAFIVLIVGMVSVAGAAYWASGSHDVKTVVPVAATGTAPVKAYVAEAPLKPVSCVAWYNVLVDAVTAEEVRKVTQAASGKSDFYELRRGAGERVRELLRDAPGRRNGGFVRTVQAREKGPAGTEMPERVNYWKLEMGRGTAAADLSFKAPWNQVMQDGNGVMLQVNFDRERAAENGDGYAMEKQALVHFGGHFDAGEAFLMLGDFGDSGRSHYVNVTVYQVYAADAREVFGLTGYQDVGEWVENGPARMRGKVDVALVWANGNEQPAGALASTERQWTRYLKDGTKVVLKRVGRPSVWPQSWWDANGGVTWDSSFIYQQGSAAVQAVVNVESLFGRSTRADISMDQRLWVEEGYPLAEGENRLTIYVATGPWEVKRIEVGDAVEVEGGYVEFKKGTWLGEATCEVQMAVEVGPESDVGLGVATKDGKWVPLDYDFMGRGRVAGVTKAGMGTTKLPQGLVERTMPVKREAFDHWVLLKRARGERVVFEGFAMEPVMRPTENVTKEELAAALRKVDWRNEHAAGLRCEEEAERREAIPRDEAVPVGAMRVLVDKARAGDVAGVKAEMAGKDAEKMEMAAEWFTTSEVLLRKCEEKFGRMEMLEGFSKRNVSISMGDDLLRGWVVTEETATDENRRWFLVKQGGKWRLDTARMDTGGMTVEQMRKKLEEMKGKMAAMERDLDGGKIGSAEEAVERVTRVVFGG